MDDSKYKIYIILMHTNTIPSRFVKLMTNYKYSHVAISLDKNCNEIYSFGRRTLRQIWNGGFTVENKNGEFFTYFKNTICTIYELDINKEQYKNLEKILLYMKENMLMYKYDFIGAFLRFFKIPISFKNKYVCSYFVADLLEKSNIYKFNKKTFFITPKDFVKIDGLHSIYSGKYIYS